MGCGGGRNAHRCIEAAVPAEMLECGSGYMLIASSSSTAQPALLDWERV